MLEKYTILHQSKNKTKQFKNHLLDLIDGVNKEYKTILFVCVGTDKSTGDSLAPIIGTLLKVNKYSNVKVFGNLKAPVHAKNLPDIIKKIPQDSLVIAIDACLGHTQNVGNISLHKGSLKPGSGVGKDLPAIGDISIKGVVNFGGFMELIVLQNTRLGFVYEMAKIVAAGIHLTLKELERRKIHATCH